MDEGVEARFKDVNWCNLALLAMRTERRSDTDDLILQLTDLYSNEHTQLEARFQDTTYMSLNVDFASSRTTGGAFDGGRCRLDSPWKQSLAKSNPYDNFDSYFHFELGLVPKGGLINVLAVNFVIRRVGRVAHPSRTD